MVSGFNFNTHSLVKLTPSTHFFQQANTIEMGSYFSKQKENTNPEENDIPVIIVHMPAADKIFKGIYCNKPMDISIGFNNNNYVVYEYTYNYENGLIYHIFQCLNKKSALRNYFNDDNGVFINRCFETKKEEIYNVAWSFPYYETLHSYEIYKNNEFHRGVTY